MPESEILKEKLILAVDDEEDVLETIQEELSEYPEVRLHTATTFEKAREYLVSFTYDLVILDIMGVRGFDLLRIASNQKMPVVMLTAHALSPEALKESIERDAGLFAQRQTWFIGAFSRRRIETELSISLEKGFRPRRRHF